MEGTQFPDPKYSLLTTSEKLSLTSENRENLATRLNCKTRQINLPGFCRRRNQFNPGVNASRFSGGAKRHRCNGLLSRYGRRISDFAVRRGTIGAPADAPAFGVGGVSSEVVADPTFSRLLVCELSMFLSFLGCANTFVKSKKLTLVQTPSISPIAFRYNQTPVLACNLLSDYLATLRFPRPPANKQQGG